jgi:hypothetical protein
MENENQVVAMGFDNWGPLGKLSQQIGEGAIQSLKN